MRAMQLGKLNFEPVEDHLDLVSEPTKSGKLDGVLVSEIDSSLSDTAAFCEQYGISMETAVNCVIVEAKRTDKVWHAAVLIQGTKRADINSIVRRELDARKISFAPMETAVKLTNMEYGAITPIGLPKDWPILVNISATELEHAIIGSGIRKSKLLVSGKYLASLPNAKVLALTKD